VDLTSAVAVNANAFFFVDVTKFFTVPGTSSHHCQSGASVHLKLLVVSSCEIGHFEFPDFFCIHRSTNMNWALPRISFTRFSSWKFRNIPFYYFVCLVSISRSMNAKKISKFEREDKTNGNPLLHHGFFLIFHENFPIYIQKDSL